MEIFLIFEIFSRNWKKLNILPTLFGSIHTCAHFSSKYVKFYIIVVLDGENMMIFFIIENFKEIDKIEVFALSGPWEPFLAKITHAIF